ncbi:MAG: nitroreductase family protein [Synergistaceae bacterium]|nr:nitroreductase family protein [Synergistaceae bacterium]MBQ3626123.1 nitroreductase family protein [Synergistaceae bacterium]MBQ4418702.1 nitroreductase family protein [Synergistaceae bacterium]MBQ9581245.1 nitroreductase family protein [Synergistaceae bacterium]MBQ9896874.1 nitroreductase family protein [Synergistaceae bacterium]
MSFLELAQERYSCRKFTEQPVEDEKIEKILDAAILAPTAVNKQPFRVWVIKSPENLEKVKETTHYHFDAKVILAVGAKPNEAWVRAYDQRNFADVDASIAATHMMLEIQDLGLGSTWVGHFDANKLKEFFPDMAAYDLIALFPIGYPAIGPHQMHSKRKAKAELARYI